MQVLLAWDSIVGAGGLHLGHRVGDGARVARRTVSTKLTNSPHACLISGGRGGLDLAHDRQALLQGGAVAQAARDPLELLLPRLEHVAVVAPAALAPSEAALLVTDDAVEAAPPGVVGGVVPEPQAAASGRTADSATAARSRRALAV